MKNTPYTQQYFPHEKLAAYELTREATRFVAARRSKLHGLPGNAAGQLARAVVGAQSNLCSGSAHRGAEARRHFAIALSEAVEAGGCIDIALDFGAFSDAEHAELRRILLRLCACLRGLTKP